MGTNSDLKTWLLNLYDAPCLLFFLTRTDNLWHNYCVSINNIVYDRVLVSLDQGFTGLFYQVFKNFPLKPRLEDHWEHHSKFFESYECPNLDQDLIRRNRIGFETCFEMFVFKSFFKSVSYLATFTFGFKTLPYFAAICITKRKNIFNLISDYTILCHFCYFYSRFIINSEWERCNSRPKLYTKSLLFI